MAHIRKRLTPNGEVRWQVRVSTRENGRRREIARDFGRKAEAEAWAADQGTLIERKQVGGGQTTFAAFLDRWLLHLTERDELEAKTIQEYRNHGRRLLPYIGTKPIERITPLDLDDAYTALQRRGGKGGRALSARTVHHVHRVAHNALARAVRWRLITSNPAAEAQPSSPGRSPALAPTGEQVKALLETGGEYRPLLWLAVLTGLRRSEILGLGWQDIDLEAKTLTVRRVAWETATAYGLKERTKTALSARTIAIGEILVEILREHKAIQAQERLRFGRYYRRDLDLCFAREGGEMLIPSVVSTAVGKLARAAGFPKGVSPLHGLRHAMASSGLAGNAISLKAMSARLGHSSVRVTADLYQHVTEEVDRASATAIDAVFRPLIGKGPTRA
jgi:integrase